MLSGISNPESRQPGKAPNFSVNWLVGDPSMEVVATMQGKTEQGSPSRLCKYEMFKLYSSVWKAVKGGGDNPMTVVYNEAKKGALLYLMAKDALFKSFDKAGLGTWMTKPLEQDLFQLDETS